MVVWKLDRLGRNTLHILETVKALTERGVILVSTTDGIDSSTAAGRMVIGVLASMAEFERELAKERTALKRATFRANGTRFGRPRKVEDSQHMAKAKKMNADGHTAKAIAKYLGVSRATLYRYLTEEWRGLEFCGGAAPAWPQAAAFAARRLSSSGLTAQAGCRAEQRYTMGNNRMFRPPLDATSW